jgi:hypothetical protein
MANPPPESARQVVAGELAHVPPGWYELDSGPGTVRLIFISSDQPRELPGEEPPPDGS